jgi:hypothetical protein
VDRASVVVPPGRSVAGLQGPWQAARGRVGRRPALGTRGMRTAEPVGLEDALDGAQPRQRADPAALQLQADRLGADARETAGAGAVGLQLGAHRQDGPHHLWRGAACHMLRGTVTREQSCPTPSLESAQPLPDPEPTSVQGACDRARTPALLMQLNRSAAQLIFVSFIGHLASPEPMGSREATSSACPVRHQR